MNGRVYDYNLGRFMSVDPFIQSPTSTQSVNPYSYIMNNPLSGTDPTGYTAQCGSSRKGEHCTDTQGAAQTSGDSKKEDQTKVSNGQKNERITARRDTRSANKVGSPSRVTRAVNQIVDWAKTVKKETASLREKGAAADIAVDFSGIESAADSLIEAAEGNYGKALLSAGGLLLGKVKAAGKLAENMIEAADGKIDVYRVFGKDARAQGFSWTPVDPKTVSNMRDAAGLPSGGASGSTNSADFLIKGRVDPNDIIKSRAALPLDGNKGGLTEYIIDPKNVEILDFSVLNK